MNYIAIQIHGKNENLSVIDKSDASCSKDEVLVIGLGQLGLPVAKYVKDEEDLIRMVMTLVQKQWIVHRK